MLLRLTALLCFLPWDYGQLISGPQDLISSSTDLSCNHSADCFENSYCNPSSGMCDCVGGFQFYTDGDSLDLSCRECPGAHETCDSCCYPEHSTTCHNKVCVCLDNNDSYACSILFQRDEFRLATEICFGALMSILILSLAIVIMKSCLRRRQIARHNSPRERNSSLTSVQLLVAQRMRDRPPRYHDRRHIRIEKPPSYEDAVTPQVTQVAAPPESRPRECAHPVRTLDCVLEDLEDGDCAGAVGGVVNPTFIVTDEKDVGYSNDDSCDTIKNYPSTELHM